MNMIEKAIRYAREVHEGQTDMSGVPFILHPLYVMSLMKNDKARIVAALHDVLEDSKHTAEDLKSEGFPDDVVEAVVTLTRTKVKLDEDKKEEAYFEYIRQILPNDLAVEVKLGDLEHNMDISRIHHPGKKDHQRVKRYKKARSILILGQRQRKIELELKNLDRKNSSVYAEQAIVFRHERADYDLYATVLRLIFENACKTYAPMAIVQARAKKLDSFIEKCYRKECREKKRDPLDPEKGFTDLCGARIIVHTTQQVNEICEFIKENFIIDWEKSGDVSERLTDSEFGYLSIHYIVSLKPDVSHILGINTQLEFLEGKKAEIQIRTLLQHSWADILHDRLYKSPAKPLHRHKRASAQLAALMETGDKQYEQFVDDFDAYSLNTTVNMPVKAVEQELLILKGMNENETYPFTKLSNALKMAGFMRIVGRYDEICSILHDFINNKNLDLDRIIRARLWYEYGYAMCKGAKTNHAHHTGISYLKKAIGEYAYLDNDDSGLWIRYKRFYIEMLLAMGECEKNLHVRHEYYERALGVDVSNPYALCNIVQADEISSARMSPILKAAIHVADDHLVSQINIPFVYFALGRLNFAAGRNEQGFDDYCRGLMFFANLPKAEQKNFWLRDKLEFEKDYLINNTKKPALEALYRAAAGLYARMYQGVTGVSKKVFTVIDGVNTVALTDALKAVGLIAAPLDISNEWAAISVLADETEQCNNDLYMFIDVDGQKAETVVKAALAMGIYVMCVNTALVEKLSKDLAPPRLCGIPNEKESLLWVMLNPSTSLDPDFVEKAAQKAHNAYVQGQTKKLWDSAPNMMQWDKLSDTFKNSNINQVMYSAELFSQNGFQLVKAIQTPQNALTYSDLTASEEEALAKSEHARWNADRVKEGWVYGEKRDDKRKRNEYIVTWDELDDEVKEYDRRAVKTLFESFAKGGYHVIRK